MIKALLLVCVICLFACAGAERVAAQATDTPTPTETETPTATFTPSVTPTPTETFTPTPDIYQYATLQSGQAVAVVYEARPMNLALIVIHLIILGLLIWGLFLMLRGQRNAANGR